MDVRRVLEILDDFLAARGCPYALAGAFALHAYGLSRATADLDIVVDGSCRGVLVSELERLGYETLHRSLGYSHHLHSLPDLGRVDCIYVTGKTAAELFGASRVVATLGRAEVRVPRPEHLAAMKAFPMRNDPSRALQEMADIQALLGLPEVDRDEVRGYFRRYGLEGAWKELDRGARP